MGHLSKGIDNYISKYDNILILGGLNAEITIEAITEFCQMYNVKNIIKEPTSYKNPNNPSSIDVILINRKWSFSNSITIETGLSDHHKMILTVLKSYIKKGEPTVINYKNYKNFNESLFRNDLIEKLQNVSKTFISYDDFKETFMNALEKYAPLKKKTIRGNTAPCMNKPLSKAFMKRSRLKNKFNKNPNDANKVAFKKQIQ